MGIKSAVTSLRIAKRDFNRVIDMNPEYAQAYVNRGTVKTIL
jgi:hypothetical protein